MVFLPIIANNLGKIAAAATTTLGLVGYVNRERIGRWLADEEPNSKERNQGRPQDLTGVLETAESIKNLHGHRLAPDELDRKHTELLDKLTAMNTKTVSDFRVILNDSQAELVTAMCSLDGTIRRLVLADGADRDKLAWVTHGPKGDIVSLYTTLPWESLCTEVAKLKVELRPPSTPPAGGAPPSDKTP
jgi:hypothetical protein